MPRTRDEALLVHAKIVRLWPLTGALVALLLVAALAGLVLLRGSPFEADSAWMSTVRHDPNSLLMWASFVMNYLGGGVIAWIIIPLGGAAGLLLARKPIAAVYWLVSLGLSAAVVQGVKQLVGRDRPLEMLVVSDHGSFPSGHTANAATIAVVLGIALRRTWIWVIGVLGIVAMALSRTYVGAHWLTDTLAGTLIGIAAAIIVWALLGVPLLKERLRPRA
ncbi:phosphatase PAP2 family protein [Microbacterium sp. MPKO10]|uniref:phosphatase PAP2 family protein n=1 Tax=Microbacterium sp. MPKO10 TaxID=2989818 RepID=UPI0022357E73|nr:phosphatase PAP2 family protein [Microbacterium sp. MPKO10]MCW4458711.1 phosphatase PAP2 family protein [Microbacterium sp. MPKO10]